MPREPRLTEADFERLGEALWVLLAVEKFGSVGNRTEVGQQLATKGLITLDEDKAALTPMGEVLAKRFREVRNR